ncbi:MAG: ABC transporter ATP-binding protein [Clostridiales bacterium]|nr:ABC transporter ATP-binding protein [Clostridiales bacterium]
MAIIELRNVTKIYKVKDAPDIRALNDVSLVINEGDFISVCGVSGSGKSTLLHLIGCLDRPTGGSVFVKGIDTKSLNEKGMARMRNNTVSMVLQDFGLIPTRTVYENLEVPFYFESDRKAKKDKIVSALKYVGCSELIGRPVVKLSGGQKQRVAIARALVKDSPILLADEPTGQLDSETKEAIMLLFHKINKNGKTVIMVTHDNEIAKETDKIIFIRDGRILDTIDTK